MPVRANWVRVAEIWGGGTPGMWEWGSFRIIGAGRRMKLGSFRKIVAASSGDWVRFAFFAWDRVAVGVNWVRFAYFGCWDGKLGSFCGIRDQNAGERPAVPGLGLFCAFGHIASIRNSDFGIPGSKRNAGVGWARFLTPPVFGVALSSITQHIIPCCLIFVKC